MYIQTTLYRDECVAVKSSLCSSLRIKLSSFQISLKSLQSFNPKSITDRPRYFRIYNINIDFSYKRKIPINNKFKKS